jgi:carotenoid 1,2-hydratase
LFDYANVPPGGYAWWYFDAVSDDGRYACACIFFIGSVFSPDYAARLRRGERVRAEEHLAVNLAVYECGRPRLWVMSEYGAAALGPCDGGGPRIAKSAITRGSDGTLTITIDDATAPFLVALSGRGRRVLGTLTLTPLGPSLPPVTLTPDATGEQAPKSASASSAASRGETAPHVWHALAPRARFRLRLERPHLAFDGIGYHDVNAGPTRLEDAFASWSWARFHDRDRTVVAYAVRDRQARPSGFIAEASDAGTRRVAAALSDGPPRRAGWGLVLPTRFTLTPDGGVPRICTPTELWDAAPFYARYAATLDEDGRRLDGMGEHLDLERFSGRGIQFLLRFKTRRARTS